MQPIDGSGGGSLARENSTDAGEPNTVISRSAPNVHEGSPARGRRISLDAVAASAGDAGVGPMRLVDTVVLVNESSLLRPVEFGADAPGAARRRCASCPSNCPSKAREWVVQEVTQRDEN